MPVRSNLLLFWAGVCAASIAAAILVVAAEVCAPLDDSRTVCSTRVNLP